MQSSKEEGLRRPNIIHIFMESMCYNDIAALGNNEVITPNLDRLVGMGTTMTNAYNQGGFSPAVCIPSRKMLYTGRSLFSLPEDHGIPGEYQLLGEYLGQCGYDTFHTGKWHMSKESYLRSHQNGQSIFCWGGGWYTECNGHWHSRLHDYDPAGGFEKENAYVTNAPMEPYEQPFTVTEPRKDCKHTVEIFTDTAINYLKSREGKDEPFYLDIPHITVHDPLQAPKRFLDMYRDRSLSDYPNYAPHHAFDNGDLHVRDECLMPWPRSEAAVRRRKKELYATITHADEQVGRILDTLEALNLISTTIIIFSSDHGCSHGQHGLVGKQSLYDHAQRVPLIICGPGIKQGHVNEGLCCLYDLYPTLCELLGLSIPASVMGQSFAENLCSGTSHAREWLYLAYLDIQRAVRNDDYKLIEYVVKGKRNQQLFKISEDPFETQDLIAHPDHENARKHMIQLLEQARSSSGDENTPHGHRYWSKRKSSTPGTSPFQPLANPDQNHLRLWRLIRANEQK